MKVRELKEQCCGCTACEHICPVNAITMEQDEEGFVYPVIDETKCIHCDACRKVCSFHENYDIRKNLDIPIAYGVKHKNSEIRRSSRSGGIFTVLSDFVLEQQGVIYGTVFDDNYRVYHTRAVTREERDKMRGSKYVQSDLGECFLQVKKDLQEDKMVLFTGTSCQTAGLRSYLKTDYDNLILCDLVCHGVPSPKLWADHLAYVKRKYKTERIDEVQFRNKEKFGWREHIESFKIGRRMVYTRAYRELFNQNYSLRPSCYECKFTNLRRPSDFTFADFWGLIKEDNFDDNKGVSLLFLNSKKAIDIFSKVASQVDVITVTNREFVHPNLKVASKRPKGREQFWDEYKKYGYSYLVKKYTVNELKALIYIIMKRLRTIIND